MTTLNQQKRNVYVGMICAFIAVVIWSGNFIIARGVSTQVPPFYLNFCRWFCAAIIIIPFSYQKFKQQRDIVRKHLAYFVAIAISGIIIYNNLLYLAGHYTSATNLALLGTTSASIFSIILAGIFLKEKNGKLRIMGLIISICGIVLLLTQGSVRKLTQFHFSGGDLLIVGCSFFFATYTVGVRKKPAGITPIVFLFVMFWIGSVLQLPIVVAESYFYPPVHWTLSLSAIILYLALGTSFIAYVCWNTAIASIGASRTALFGNLLPILSTVEAAFILHESIKPIHIVSLCLVILGLAIANWERMRHD